MQPYSEQPTTEILYRLFSHEDYKISKSYVLRSGQFELDPLFQKPKVHFVADTVVEKSVFIPYGPEYN